MKTKSLDLPRAKTPEEAGVSSYAVEKFLEYIKKEDLEFHSLMVIRHGKVAVEWYNEPYNAQSKHAMYSVSKSFTSTAVGFAIDEGLFSLDDKVLDFFPEYTPKTPSPYFDELTVRRLLTMTAGKQTNMLADKGKIDWIEDYINSPWAFEPGTSYLYVNENIFMLCAIIMKTAKMTVTEFLTPRLYEPLGIEVPFWETDPHTGIEAGGWGLFVSTEDLAKVMTCYLHGGKYKGVQVIPEFWAKEATSNQIGDIKMPSEDPDCHSGYGFCFWMNDTDPVTYRADGMFSQFGINFPELDATIVTTSAIPVEELGRKAVWNSFPEGFIDENAKPKPIRIQDSTIENPGISQRSELEKKINGRTIKIRKKLLLNIIGMPVSMLPLAVTFMMSDRAGNINNVKFMFADAECSITWDEGDENNTVFCGMDGHYRYGSMTLGGITFKVCANAVWLDDINLQVSIRPLETIGKRTLNFLFRNNNKVTMTPSSTPSTYKIVSQLAESIKEVIKNPIIANIGAFFIRFAPPVAEPKHYGKFID